MNPVLIGVGAIVGAGALLLSSKKAMAGPTSYALPEHGSSSIPGYSRRPVTQGSVCPAPMSMPSTYTGDLGYLHPDFRSKVQTLLSRLEARGFQPRVHTSWRSDSYQQDLVRRGRSWTDYSFHNVVDRCGQPMSMAVDIIDRRWAWGDKAQSRGFWLALQEEAERLGLHSGNRWTGQSWDPAHVQAYSNGSGMLARLQDGYMPRVLSFAGA